MGTLIIIVAAAVLLAAVAGIFAMAIKSARKEKEEALALLRETHEAAIQGLKSGHEATLQGLKASHEATVTSLKEGYERTISEMRIGHQREMTELKTGCDKALAQQLETVKAQVTAESEKMLKAREEELEKRAKQTFESITGTLGKDIKDMKEAFDKNRETHTQTSQGLKENLEQNIVVPVMKPCWILK